MTSEHALLDALRGLTSDGVNSQLELRVSRLKVQLLDVPPMAKLVGSVGVLFLAFGSRCAQAIGQIETLTETVWKLVAPHIEGALRDVSRGDNLEAFARDVCA
jgi:hypothetical protein